MHLAADNMRTTDHCTDLKYCLDCNSSMEVTLLYTQQVQEDSPGVCEVYNKEDVPCIPLPPDVDPCLKIMDPTIFGEVSY